MLSDLAPADFYLFPQLKSALKRWCFCDAIADIANVTEELCEGNNKMVFRNVSNNFTVAGRSLLLTSGTILKKM